MSDDGFPELTCRYSRRSRLSFGTAFLILGYGGVGMVTGLIDIAPEQRPVQVLIGIAFLALTGSLFFHWTINRIYVDEGYSLLLRYKGPLVFGSRTKVERVRRYLLEPQTAHERQPLVAARGLFRN